MKKLGIFLYNNQNGSVEEYIQFLLADIAPNLSHLCVVINDELNSADNKNTAGMILAVKEESEA